MTYVEGKCIDVHKRTGAKAHQRREVVYNVTVQGLACGANLWFGGFPYPVNPGRPEWSKVQTRGKPLVATAQAKYVSAGE